MDAAFPAFRACFAVREDAPAQFLSLAEALLRDGKIVVVFPEAWRTPNGQLQPFRAGVGQLLARAQVPAIPVAVLGSFAAWPRHHRLPRLHPIEIRVGDALAPSEFARGTSDDPRAIAEALHNRVAELLTPRNGP